MATRLDGITGLADDVADHDETAFDREGRGARGGVHPARRAGVRFAIVSRPPMSGHAQSIANGYWILAAALENTANTYAVYAPAVGDADHDRQREGALVPVGELASTSFPSMRMLSMP